MRIRDNKGSITMFVLVGVLFMSGFLLLSFGSNVNKSKIAQEQLEIINDIYSNNEGDSNAYNRAYEALRSNNKEKFIYDSKEEGLTSVSTVNLKEKTFEEKLVNYQIYGSMGKSIVIEVTNGTESREYTINLFAALGVR